MMMMSGCGGGVLEALNTRVYNGNGSQTLVLSHGYGSDQSVWHLLIPYLALYFKVVVFDLVFAPNVSPKLYDAERYSNFGAYAEDLICVMDQLHLKNAVFLGHSMSAMVGCIAATKRPELFEHLILLCGSPRYLNTKEYYGGFKRSDVEAILVNIKHNFSGWVHDFAPIVTMNDTTSIAKFEQTLGSMKPDIALSVAKTVFLTDNRWVLPQVDVPSTIIQSEMDIIVPRSVPFYMKEKIGGGDTKVKILQKTEGHFPQLASHLLLLKVLNKILNHRV